VEKELLEALAAGYEVTLRATQWGGFTCRISKMEQLPGLAEREWSLTGYDNKLPDAIKHGVEALRNNRH
jgi:hypothetical protein